MWVLMLREGRTMTLVPQRLIYVLYALIAILLNSQPTFAYPQDITIGDNSRIESTSGVPAHTASADDSSSSASDNEDSGTLDVIGNQSFGVQFGGGFVVGCIIGVLGYILYRILTNCIRKRRSRRRHRAGGDTRGTQVENGPEAGEVEAGGAEAGGPSHNL